MRNAKPRPSAAHPWCSRTSLLNIDSDQPILDNCVDILLGAPPIADSTLTADIAFGGAALPGPLTPCRGARAVLGGEGDAEA
ncbi:hypothetical protein ACIQOV_37220 [Kitasatospora sp. NPDC091257]|uniref:hypothetical protein n=1 Tax=unclassified Kitasatospora TaxID=2633591 RepID=UPI002F908D96